MSAYGALAAWYDALTRDVDYAAFADFYEQCFQQGRGESHTLLDFCCGTGTLTRLMAARGYEMIATDGSPDMLMQAQAHNADLPPDAVAPLVMREISCCICANSFCRLLRSIWLLVPSLDMMASSAIRPSIS